MSVIRESGWMILRGMRLCVHRVRQFGQRVNGTDPLDPFEVVDGAVT